MASTLILVKIAPKAKHKVVNCKSDVMAWIAGEEQKQCITQKTLRKGGNEKGGGGGWGARGRWGRGGWGGLVGGLGGAGVEITEPTNKSSNIAQQH